jgi:Zn-dependent protease
LRRARMAQSRKLEKNLLFRQKKNAKADGFAETTPFRFSLYSESQAIMLPSWKLGRLFGIPVYLHSTLILLPALVMFNTAGLGWPSTLLLMAATGVLFGCVLLHEFGHALMARWFHIRTRDVTLYPIGGIARLENMTERPSEEMLIALAGPAVNVLIAALLTPLFFFLVLVGGQLFPDPVRISFDDPALTWLTKLIGLLWFSNILLVVFNLIPAFPMDGGRVLRAILSHFFGLLRGTEIAVPLGMVVIAVVALGMTLASGFNPMLFVIAAFIALTGPLELRALRYREQQKNQTPLAEKSAPPSVDLPYTPLPYPDEDEAYPSPPPTTPVLKPGFTGYTWDREFGVWVKWQNGRRVAAYWNGPE